MFTTKLELAKCLTMHQISKNKNNKLNKVTDF